MIYFQIQISSGKTIAGNMQEFSGYLDIYENRNYSQHKDGKGIRSAEDISDGISTWVVVVDEYDLLKSSKLFRKTLEIYKKVALDVWKYHKSQMDAHSHTLTTIQGQIRQQLEGFASDESFHGNTYNDSLNHISQLVSNDIFSAADLICYVHKRAIDMRAHMLGVEIIHAGAQYEIKPATVSLKRAILNQCTPFLEELDKNSVKIHFFFDDEFNVEVDKNMFSLIMYNFFSNTVKYAKPNTDIRLFFDEETKILDISMISLKIDRSEIMRISNEGVRGKNVADIPGKGIGLFVLQKALELMGKEKMYIQPSYEHDHSEHGIPYTVNKFKFSL